MRVTGEIGMPVCYIQEEILFNSRKIQRRLLA